VIWLVIGLGGAIGSAARHGVNVAITHTIGRSVPYATAAVNISGCFTIGLLAGLVAHGRLTLSPTLRAFIFVGILGGFTTFSSFGLDTLTLATTGDRWLALWNVAGQVVIGIGAVFAGFYLGRI